ncbi:MAG: PAS domain-containing protein [Acetobacteraceae bacterium]|nr:PAS domain-containing protein [Acetobacteraceae bacterium]MBV8589684.1 PAS domain-containing protein [Acetobacteraceae bacterium]
MLSGAPVSLDWSHIFKQALSYSDSIILVFERKPATPPTLPILGANEAFLRATNTRSEQLVREDFLSFFCAQSCPASRSGLAWAISAGTAWRNEILCSRRGGQPFWLGYHLIPIEGPAGEAWYVLHGHDITEQRLAIQRQQAAEGLMAAVFRTMDASIAITTSRGRILMTNLHLDRLLDAEPGSLEGENFRELIADTDREAFVRAQEQPLSHGPARSLQVTLLRKGGVAVRVRISCAVAERPDAETVLVLTIREITETVQSAPSKHFQVAGKLRLVGLEEVRAALGAEWDRLAERAVQTAEHVLRSRLSPGDTFSRTDDHGLLICFANASEEEASFRAAAIGQEIQRRLIGQGETAIASSVTAIAAAVSADAEGGQNRSFHASLERRLNERRQEVERQAEQALEAVIRTAHCVLEPVIPRNGRDILARYACLPPDQERAVLSARTVLGPTGVRDFDYDSMLLTLAVERIIQDAAQGVLSLCFVDVGLEVFTIRARTERLLSICRSIPLEIRHRMVMMLAHVPADIARPRITDAVQRLRPFCRSVGLSMQELAAPPLDPYLLAGSIVSLELDQVVSDGTLQEARLRQLLDHLHTNRIRLLVRNASPKRRKELEALGVDLIGSGVPA